jgi:redox-sensitive bicupin YhaK (pirin superfamily)
MLKKILQVESTASHHWVGDGFPVRTLFSRHSHSDIIDPFLLLDYAGPHDFPPAQRPRGVGEHPHRGFETVTIVYQGEVEHLDSTSSGGKIGPGDVQWMTAAGGIIHEEFHSRAFTQAGGILQMVQLWVNLPAKVKMARPRYQSILDAQIPSVALADGAGRVRVIAGSLHDQRGPAETFTPMDVWDVRINAGATVELPQVAGRSTLLVVLQGAVTVNHEREVAPAQLVILDRDGDALVLTAAGDTTVLLLSGEPIGEPVVAHGPFVMNTEEEIHQAFADFRSGRFGELPA